MNCKFEEIFKARIHSGYKRLEKESLAMILGGKSTTEGTGGCSCGQTGSSCGCDDIRVCNCIPPIIEYPPISRI